MHDGEQAETRIKRLRMRSMRRGTREMDLILMQFSEAGLAELSPALLDDYELLLSENDHRLYSWVSRQEEPPSEHLAIVDRIRAYLRIE
jgi:antitoxin CptB